LIESTCGEAYNRIAMHVHIPIQILAFNPASESLKIGCSKSLAVITYMHRTNISWCLLHRNS